MGGEWLSLSNGPHRACQHGDPRPLEAAERPAAGALEDRQVGCATSGDVGASLCANLWIEQQKCGRSPPKVPTAGWVETTDWVATIPTSRHGRAGHPVAACAP